MSKHQRQTTHFTEDRGNWHCSTYISLSDILPVLICLGFRHPVVGHRTEGPRYYHEEAPHGPVVCSPDDAAETYQKRGPRC